jgi:type II secretory pathway component PulC
MRRALIGLTNVALFTVTCWLVSVVFNEILAERLQPRGVSLRADETHSLEGAPSWAERKVIVDRNLFGAKVARQETKAPPPVEVKEEVEETRLPLKLQGTLWSSDPALSTAAIHDKGKRIEQILAVGDSLEERNGVEVAAIERGRVILLNGSRREELLLSEEGDPRESGPRATEGAGQGSPPTRT